MYRDIEDLICTLICPLMRPEKSMILYHPVMVAVPVKSTPKSIAVKPMIMSSTGFGSRRACGISVDVLRHTFRMKRFSSYRLGKQIRLQNIR